MEEEKMQSKQIDEQIDELTKKMSACMRSYYKHKDDPEWHRRYNDRKNKEAKIRYHSNEEERRKKIERSKNRYWKLKAENEAKQKENKSVQKEE